MANWQHDPFLNYNANLLKQSGIEQYTTGRETQQKGQALTDKGVGDLQPVYDYFKKLLSSDTTELLSAVQPEADAIGQQFSAVRSMIADQPRGGGKTSALASNPIEHIRALSNLMSNARTGAAHGASDTASKVIGAGQNESGVGLNQTGQGESATGAAANIGQQGRATDMANSWTSFFKQLAVGAVGGLGEGAGAGLIKHFL